MQQISFQTQEILYTPSAKTARITEGDQRMYFTYDAGDERIMTKLVELDNGNENILLKKYFVGLYEKEVEGTTERHIHYIMAGDGLTAIAIQENEDPTETYFTYKDHLGSIVALTDVNGDVFFEQSFDAWGRYRNPDDWTYDNITEPPTWLRGYTGHEHLVQFDLVNMNGRMYDPKLGRMLRPDNFVQDPMFTQSYNRYAYAFNNPLKFTDPDGEFIVAASLFAVAGAYMFTAWHNRQNGMDLREWDWSWGSGTYGAMLTGAIAGFTFVAGPVSMFGLTAASGTVATTTTATTVAAKGSKTATVSYATKAVASTYSGLLNVMYNYSKERKIGWHTLGDFTAGFTGTWIGLEAGLGYGLLAGGGLNVITTPELYNGGDVSGYRLAQRFVGGALSSYSGMALAGQHQYVKFGKKYLFDSPAVSKAMTYGIQGSLSDFAYTSEYYYRQRTFGQHVGIFFGSFMNGLMNFAIQENFNSKSFQHHTGRFLAGGASYLSDYATITSFQGYNPSNYQYAGKKIGIGQYKSLFSNLIIYFVK